jgi:hypothetical protein
MYTNAICHELRTPFLLLPELDHNVRDFNILLGGIFSSHLENDVLLMGWDFFSRDGCN